MIITIPVKKDEQTEIVAGGKYRLTFNKYIIWNKDLTDELLRLVEKREFKIYGYLIKTGEKETKIIDGEERHRITIEIDKEEKTEGENILGGQLVLIVLLTILGLAVLYLVLYKIEKIIAEIPDIVLITGVGVIGYTIIKKLK